MPDCGAGAAPARGFAIRSRAVLGIVPAGITTGLPGVWLTWLAERIESPQGHFYRSANREARPGAEWWRSVPRWSAERRACCAQHAAASAQTVCADCVNLSAMRPTDGAPVGALPPSRFSGAFGLSFRKNRGVIFTARADAARA